MKQGNILVQVWFATSKAGLNFYTTIQVASRVAEWLKLGNIRKISKLVGGKA